MSQVNSNKKVLRSRSRSQSRSPGRALKKKPVRTENQIKKLQKKDHFNGTIDTLYKNHKNLKKLQEKYSKVNPAHQLNFTKGDESRVLTRKELNAAEADFCKQLLGLKKLYMEGTKHSKTPILPTSFKAAYTPAKVGQIFVSFLSEVNKKKPNFGLAPNTEGTAFLPKSNLLDLLPRAKEGFMLKNSLTLLLYIYSTVNELKSKLPSEGQKNIPDERMNFIFGKLPALYYQESGEDKQLMTNSGHNMTTYDVVSGKNPKFNPNKIENYYFRSIQSINIYQVEDLSAKDVDLLKKHKDELLSEFYIIEKANILLKKIKGQK